MTNKYAQYWKPEYDAWIKEHGREIADPYYQRPEEFLADWQNRIVDYNNEIQDVDDWYFLDYMEETHIQKFLDVFGIDGARACLAEIERRFPPEQDWDKDRRDSDYGEWYPLVFRILADVRIRDQFDLETFCLSRSKLAPSPHHLLIGVAVGKRLVADKSECDRWRKFFDRLDKTKGQAKGYWSEFFMERFGIVCGLRRFPWPELYRDREDSE